MRILVYLDARGEFAKYHWPSKRSWTRRDSELETEQYAERLRNQIDELGTELHELVEAGW